MHNPSADPFGIVGQVLDAQFRVDRLVGEGGFSAVYRGFHLGLQEPIAIKCLKLPPTLSPALVEQFEKRFRDESRILYRLSQGNLNIVRSIAGGTWQSPAGFVVPFMILEWLEGRSLANEFTIRRTVGNQGRTLLEVIKLFGSAADGLAHAHAQGVVHRDLNPGNLFLVSTQQGVRMKVLDFGVAKILDDSTLNIGPRTQTVGQIRIFAPAYGAPEQFDDALGRVGAASDVYSFSLILLEAMRDRCVNDGQHLGEFAQRAIDPNRRPTPRSLGIDVPDEVEQIFVRATKLNPAERWQSAGELWQALTIATNEASQVRHQKAAMETPPLAMPTSPTRSTKTGMGPPPAKQGGTARIDKTLPINAVMPNFPGFGQPRPAAGAPASETRMPAAKPLNPALGSTGQMPRAPAPPSAPRVPNAAAAARPQHSKDEETRVAQPLGATVVHGSGGRAPIAHGEQGESEEEVTRVRAPDQDVLRGLAEADLRAGRTVAQPSAPRPAAGAPPPPPSSAPDSDDEPHGGGTLMMAPGMNPAAALARDLIAREQAAAAAQQQQKSPSGQHNIGNLASTMPLTGPHPLGMGQQHAGGPPTGPTPAAGMSAQYNQQAQQQPPATMMMMSPPLPGPGQQTPQPPQGQHQQQQPPPPQQQQQHHLSMPQPPFQTHPGAVTQPGQQRMGESMSLPPQSVAGVPKKNNMPLIIGLAAGGFVLLGIIGAIAIVVSRRDGGTGPASSSSVPSASLSIASAPPPPPPPPTDTAPPPPPEDVDSGTVAAEDGVDAGAQAVNVNPNQNPTPNPNPNPNTNPDPLPTPRVEKDAGPPVDPNAWNEGVARSRLAGANSVIPVFCKKEGGVTGPGSAMVTFNPDGSVASVAVDPPYAGTPAGDCVAGQLRRVKANPYQGSPQALRHSFEIPK